MVVEVASWRWVGGGGRRGEPRVGVDCGWGPLIAEAEEGRLRKAIVCSSGKEGACVCE